MRTITRLSISTVAAGAAFFLSAGVASAHECTNADKPAGAGAQVIINAETGEIEWATKGLQNRFAQGLIDPATGEGYHGLIGLDFDGDGTADVSTYIVGPNGELPETAQSNGATCHGIVFIGDYFSLCQV